MEEENSMQRKKKVQNPEVGVHFICSEGTQGSHCAMLADNDAGRKMGLWAVTEVR